MIYKNNKAMMIVLLLAILVLLYYSYQFKSTGYRVFGMFGVIWASIFYVFTLFEYYKIDNAKIIHVYRLGFRKDEVYWKDINRIFIFTDRYVKAVKVDYGIFNGRSMIINCGINRYKELVKEIIEKTRNNPNITIDKKLNDFIR